MEVLFLLTLAPISLLTCAFLCAEARFFSFFPYSSVTLTQWRQFLILSSPSLFSFSLPFSFHLLHRYLASSPAVVLVCPADLVLAVAFFSLPGISTPPPCTFFLFVVFFVVSFTNFQRTRVRLRRGRPRDVWDMAGGVEGEWRLLAGRRLLRRTVWSLAVEGLEGGVLGSTHAFELRRLRAKRHSLRRISKGRQQRRHRRMTLSLCLLTAVLQSNAKKAEIELASWTAGKGCENAHLTQERENRDLSVPCSGQRREGEGSPGNARGEARREKKRRNSWLPETAADNSLNQERGPLESKVAVITSLSNERHKVYALFTSTTLAARSVKLTYL
ncbi:putative transmembrane protein [Toxoplasma gondii GAB2-2007-GAL-DOM2]|uniref:Putative transmembrane protein n=3 Tax=Toxoplasma gondii TaxID=5811 RepID=A0A086KCH1_TOXGO|nr:putative transmembrane protein [Toxoplasma gondii GAB2-2007-GAL-DOM2]KFG42089.1 putative transmembrane protein [Toxoplasma gondii FOU]RQX74021.1 putative transmembrane protein [Toxoplasma gondii CAST]